MMKNNIAGIAAKTQLSVAAFLLASAASAQMVTMDYKSEVMTGSNAYLDSEANGGMGHVPITGFFSAELMLSNGNLVSYDASFSASDGQVYGLETGSGNFVHTGTPDAQSPQSLFWSGPTGNSISVMTDAQGAIEGASFSFFTRAYHSPWTTFYLGAGTDGFSWTPPYDPCQLLNAASGTYCGSTASGESGEWEIHSSVVAAPEIDPASAASGLTLLLGGVAVLRGRRKLD